METGKIKIVEWDIEKLIPSEYNPRFMTESQVSDLKASVKRFGLVDPILVNTHKDRYGIIVGGHMRVNVAREIGLKKIPCVELHLAYEQEKELNVRLNKNTGSWNHDDLANYFEIEELASWGWSNEEIKFTFEGGIDAEEEKKKDNSKGTPKTCPNCGTEI